MLIGIYIVLINIIAFFFMGIDKRRAINKRWRIPELNLFALAMIGGAIGVYTGMKLFHHKTKHASFRIGIPLLIVLNIAAIVFIVNIIDL